MLAQVVAGSSMRATFSAQAGRLHDARDRALLSTLLHEGARWWLRFDPIVDELLERPIRTREPVVHALLLLGLVQREILQLPDYVAVAATVEAARALGKPKFAGLVNAVLRRWLRERDARNARLDAVVRTRSAHPDWLVDAIRSDWPQHVQTILEANNVQAPFWLRVNRRRTTRSEQASRLAAVDVACAAPEHVADALVLERSTDVTMLPGYAEGLFSVQDGAAQFAANVLDAHDGMRVLDACAAPGGKSAQILEYANVDLLALDSDAQRLPRLRQNLDRLGLAADIRVGDAGDPASWMSKTGENQASFDRILVDAPCSATGIIRRQPDIKLHRRAADIPALVRSQKRLLDALWPLLRPGGRLVYATCSVLAAENAQQVAAFLRRHEDARTLSVLPHWHVAGAGAQNLPGEGGMDGFFYAVVEKAD